MYAKIAVLRPVDNIYTYKIPSSLINDIKLGQLVTVPFGYGKVKGVILDIDEKPPKFKTKDILSIEIKDPIIKGPLTKLAKWMIDYYQIFPESILKLMIPKNLKPIKVTSSRRLQPALNKHRQTLDIKLSKNEEGAVELVIKSKKPRYLLFTNRTEERYKVYLKLFSNLSKNNNTVMFLFPEVSQARNFYYYFTGHIETDTVLWNAKLTPKQKTAIWWGAKTNKIRCLIGTRSMIFLPVQNIKLLAVDEEESQFYKSEKNPKYFLPEVAQTRAKFEGSIYLIGTNSPSIEAFAGVMEGETRLSEKIELIDLRRRERKIDINIIDLKEEHEKGYKSFLTPKLRKSIIESKKNNEKVILFYNRRGYSTYVFCKRCGQELMCPRCSKPLIYDQQKKFVCHICNFILEKKPVCGNCDGTEFKYSGAGTQKVIKEIKGLIFNSKIVRLDKDSLKDDKNLLEKCKEFLKSTSDILVGTKIIFHPCLEGKVNLFGIINFDQILNFPDYHVAQRAYQILIKAKSLLSKSKGKIIIQTRHPNHYVLHAFLSQSYELFYNEEIKRRKELEYPPFTKLARALVWGDNQEEVKSAAQLIYRKLKNKKSNYQLFDAMEAPQEKMRGKFYWQLIFKGEDLKMIRKDFKEVVVNIKSGPKLGMVLDIDPVRI